jgi:signal peptidase
MTKTRLRQISTNIILALSVGCFVASMLFIAFGRANDGESFIFGVRPYIVTSGSMSPELAVNSLTLVAQSSYDDVAVGDIISYRSGNSQLPVSHRVIEKTDVGLVTKGDNVSLADEQPVTPEMFHGKLIWHTNFLAGYITFVQSRGVLAGVALPMLVIFAIIAAIYLFPKKSIKLKEDRQDVSETP